TTGLLARCVEDCELIDDLVSDGPAQASQEGVELKGVTLAYAPRQHLVDIDVELDSLFRETLRVLKDAGAHLIEVDLGDDFFALADRITWPIFFHDTTPAIRDFIETNAVPVSFEEIYAGLGDHTRESWSRSVLPSGAQHVSAETYQTALTAERQELRRRFASIVFDRAEA